MTDELIYYRETDVNHFTSLTMKYDGGIMFRKSEGKFMWSVAKRNGQWETFGTERFSNGKIISMNIVSVPKPVVDEGKREIRAHLRFLRTRSLSENDS